MKFKKVLLTLCTVALMVNLPACGSSNGTNEPVSSTSVSSDATNSEPVSETEVDVSVNETPDADGNDGEIRVEIKDALDECEGFFDQYCEFMSKYEADPSDADLLTDYADFIAKYDSTMDKLESLKNDDLNNEELEYYTEVMTRIEEKLSEVAE